MKTMSIWWIKYLNQKSFLIISLWRTYFFQKALHIFYLITLVFNLRFKKSGSVIDLSSFSNFDKVLISLFDIKWRSVNQLRVEPFMLTSISFKSNFIFHRLLCLDKIEIAVLPKALLRSNCIQIVKFQ